MRGKGRYAVVCGQSGESAFVERANPNGCGPEGRAWVKRGAAAAASTPVASALAQAAAALEQAQKAVSDAAKAATE